MKRDDKDLKCNGEGYLDPTAYKAIKNTIKATDERNRLRDALDDIYCIARANGFEIEGRIVLTDISTGKVYK